MERLAIVVVTFKRQQLLSELFDSILRLTQAPWLVYVVDNENSPQTARACEQFAAQARRTQTEVIYAPMQSNLGGTGGFAEGIRGAYQKGAQWFWLMDDDVVVLPEAIEVFDQWAPKAQVIQGQRLDYDGGFFYWQYRFNTGLGIYNMFSSAEWKEQETYKLCNAVCFEGVCMNRAIIEKIGLPDARMFIYLDDALYGYLASKYTDVYLVPDFVLKRNREVPHVEVGRVRQLNSASDMSRFYIVRNRGFLARYYRIWGDYHPLAFALGTALTFAKELSRLVLVDRSHLVSGTKRLFAGWRAQRRIQKDPDFKPAEPLI